MTIESVPNFSEGRDAQTIELLRDSIAATPGAHLLHTTSDADHNRTVFTLAGEPLSVRAAALAAMEVALARIDLSLHTGVHPRIGALDVLPFIPLANSTMEECAALARDTGEAIWTSFRVPVYFYEFAARTPERRPLETFRHPNFPGVPDIGSGRHPTAGAAIVGARNLLIAWNIWLDSTDISLARAIARVIRASSGGFPGIKALGLPLASRQKIQIAINTTDFQATPLHTVFDAVQQHAQAAGVPVSGSELIGLIPEAALSLSEGHDLRWLNLAEDSVLERRLARQEVRIHH